MEFDVFAPGRPSSDEQDAPTLHVLADGRLVLNAAAQQLLGETTFVQLFWDEDTKRIGIMPSDRDDPDSFRVIATDGQSIVTSKAFVDEFALPLSRRMPLAWDGRMWVASTEEATA
jgi:hypothetical protein